MDKTDFEFPQVTDVEVQAKISYTVNGTTGTALLRHTDEFLNGAIPVEAPIGLIMKQGAPYFGLFGTMTVVAGDICVGLCSAIDKRCSIYIRIDDIFGFFDCPEL